MILKQVDKYSKILEIDNHREMCNFCSIFQISNHYLLNPNTADKQNSSHTYKRE